MLASLRPALSLLIAVALLAPASFAFDIPLSDEAIREAYFLGQRRDEKTAQFFEKYNRRLTPPESGPYISDIAFFTPYANAVELSRQNSLGYSAQDALQAYKKHGDIVSVVITIVFTASYGALLEKPVNSRSGSTRGYQFRSANFWRDFSYRLFQHDELIEPLDFSGQATYAGNGDSSGSSDLSGAVITLTYDAAKISSAADADVVVDTIADHQLVTTFDLATLR
jgi:hypothetical protein